MGLVRKRVENRAGHTGSQCAGLPSLLPVHSIAILSPGDTGAGEGSEDIEQLEVHVVSVQEMPTQVRACPCGRGRTGG